MKETLIIKDKVFGQRLNYDEILNTIRKGRIVGSILIFIIYMIIKLFSGLPLPFLPVTIILLTEIFINSPNKIIKKYISDPEILFYLTILLDIIFITLILFFTGGAASFFSFLYLFPILFCYTKISLEASLNVASISGVLYLILYLSNIFLNYENSLFGKDINVSILTAFTGINLFLIFAFPIFSSFLIEPLKNIILNLQNKLSNQIELNRTSSKTIRKDNKSDIFSSLFNALKDLYNSFFISILAYNCETEMLKEIDKKFSNMNYFHNNNPFLNSKNIIRVNGNTALMNSLKQDKITKFNSLRQIYHNLELNDINRFEHTIDFKSYYFFPIKTNGCNSAKTYFLIGFKKELDTFDLHQINTLLEVTNDIYLNSGEREISNIKFNKVARCL
jgi:hypothetical protein